MYKIVNFLLASAIAGGGLALSFGIEVPAILFSFGGWWFMGMMGAKILHE